RPAGRAVYPGRPAAPARGAGRPDRLGRVRGVAPGGDAMTKTDTKSTVLLKHHLKALRLPTVLAECEQGAQRAAAENVDHLAFLLQVCESELIERERKAAERRLKAARFPAAKTLDAFDFAARPSVNKPLVLDLVRGDYLTRHENVLLVGPSGTGKPQPTQYPSGHGGVRRPQHRRPSHPSPPPRRPGSPGPRASPGEPPQLTGRDPPRQTQLHPGPQPRPLHTTTPGPDAPARPRRCRAGRHLPGYARRPEEEPCDQPHV